VVNVGSEEKSKTNLDKNQSDLSSKKETKDQVEITSSSEMLNYIEVHINMLLNKLIIEQDIKIQSVETFHLALYVLLCDTILFKINQIISVLYRLMLALSGVTRDRSRMLWARFAAICSFNFKFAAVASRLHVREV